MPSDVSVVAAVFNDRSTLEELCGRIRRTLGGQCEIVLVDDGSTDGSAALMERLGVTSVRLAQNVGQNGAILAGLRVATGAVCCVVDADLEDPPEALPRLIDALGDGVTRVAFSTRDGRRRMSSRVFRHVMQWIYPTLPPRACLCFAIDRPASAEVVRIASASDYLVAVIGALALPAREVAIAREVRRGRASGYPGLARLRHARRLLWASLRLRWRFHRHEHLRGRIANAGSPRI